MKILKISMLALGTSLCGLAQADVIGVKGDVSYWAYDGKANMATQTSAQDQDLDRKGAAQISLAVEHPVPLIPNAKIRYVNLKTQTENEVLGQPVYDLDIDHTDFILYYEILDNVVNADVGFGATNLNGDVKTLNLTKTDIDKTIPIIYGSAGVKLPFTGLSAKGELLYSNFCLSFKPGHQSVFLNVVIDCLPYFPKQPHRTINLQFFWRPKPRPAACSMAFTRQA